MSLLTTKVHSSRTLLVLHFLTLFLHMNTCMFRVTKAIFTVTTQRINRSITHLSYLRCVVVVMRMQIRMNMTTLSFGLIHANVLMIEIFNMKSLI
jgi:hypothetical protein